MPITTRIFLILTFTLVAACSGENGDPDIGNDGGHDGGPDAGFVSDMGQVLDAAGGFDVGWPELPPRPLEQTCTPGPVDFDVRPDVIAMLTMDNVNAHGIVALHQPLVTGDWWVAYADGRLGTVKTGPGATPFRAIMQWPDPILDMLLDPGLGKSGLVYVSFGHGATFRILALHIEGTYIRSEEQIFSGVGAGLLTMNDNGALHVTTTHGLVSVETGEIVHAGEELGRCHFEDEGPWCFGEQSLQCAAVDGVIYRGSDAPALWGARVYACEQSLRAREYIDGAWVDRQILTHTATIIGVFTDRLGRLHGYDANGHALRLRLAEPNHALGWPELLSQTHCLDAETEPGPDLIPYGVNAPLWTDGAIKRRWMVVPPGTRIEARDIAEWLLPIGSVVVKQFDLADENGVVRPVETRIMTRWQFGWSFHSYRWRDDGSDADLLDGTRSVYRTVTTENSTFEYLFPGRQTCETCHRGQSASVLALSTEQLKAGPPGMGQLDRLLAAGIIEQIPEVSAVPDPDDTSQSLHRRARATLHAQCAHCHQPQGWVPPDLNLDLRWSTPWGEAHLCGEPNQYGSLNGQGELRLSPGHPENSTIITRQLVEGYERMPFGTALVDPRVVNILRPWIANMVDCSPP